MPHTAGEDLLTAAVREAKEEVAVDVHEARLATVVHVARPDEPANTVPYTRRQASHSSWRVCRTVTSTGRES